MVPVYCVASWCSFKYTWWETYFTAIADAYEAIAIASFFSLLTFYVGPNLHDQKEYFRTLTNIKMWIPPVRRWAKRTGGPEKGPFRTPKSGLTWFNIVWTGVFQYCFVMSMLAILSIITEATHRYCRSSESPAFFHLWVRSCKVMLCELVVDNLQDTIFKTISVIVAMMSIIQTYVQMKEDLSQYNPLLKIVAIKLVIFLSFWQNFVLNILTSPNLNAITPTKYLAYPDIRVGIPMMLLCIEMAIFSVFHLFAFSYRTYIPGPHNTYKYPIPSGLQTGPLVNEIADKRLGGFLGFRAFLDAANIIDIISGVARGARWVFVGRKTRHQDKSYGPKTDGSLHDVSLENTNTEYSGSKAYEMPRVAARPDDHANLIHDAGPDPSMSPQSSPVQNQGPYADVRTPAHQALWGDNNK